MRITGVLADDCPNGLDCPRIHDTDGDDVIVQGVRLTDLEALAELHLPEHESAVVVPRNLVYPTAMTLAVMADWIGARHSHHLLRIENRSAYASASDGGDFARYLKGETEPDEGAAWQDRLRRDTAGGRRWAKVHILRGEPTEYERYEFDWGFNRTVGAGEDVRILEVASTEFPDVPDFFVVDHEHVVRSVYSDTGAFVAAHVVTGPDAAVYRALAASMWARGERFTSWWEAHPEAHRRPRAA